MKKSIMMFALVGVMVLAGASIVSASTDIYGCMKTNATNYNPLATIDNGTCAFPSNGNPQLVVQPWGLNGYQTPIVTKGTITIDQAGIVDICNVNFGCFDISKTPYYIESMKDLARQLIAKGQDKLFPRFTYWVNLVR